MNRIGTASSYIGSRQGAQTATEEQLYQQATTLARAINTESKTFLEKEWAAFVTAMKKVTINMF